MSDPTEGVRGCPRHPESSMSGDNCPVCRGGEADPTAGERNRCDTCADTGRMPWMIEGDPNCYQEPDSDGMLPCIDCSPAEPDAGDVEALAEVILAERLVARELPNDYMDDAELLEAMKPRARAVLASDWLASLLAATADRARREGAAEAGERIAQAIEATSIHILSCGCHICACGRRDARIARGSHNG